MDTVVCERPTSVLTAASGVRVDSTTGRTVLPDGRESLDRFVSTGGVTFPGWDSSTLRLAAAFGVSVFDASERFSVDHGPGVAEVEPEPACASSLVTTSGGDGGEFAADDSADDPVDCDDPVDDLIDGPTEFGDITDVDEVAEEPPLTPADVDGAPLPGSVDPDESVEVELADDPDLTRGIG